MKPKPPEQSIAFETSCKWFDNGLRNKIAVNEDHQVKATVDQNDIKTYKQKGITEQGRCCGCLHDLSINNAVCFKPKPYYAEEKAQCNNTFK